MTNIGSTALTILEFVLAFGVLILLHELGHFLMARANKIEVEEFGIGYPPKMVKLFRAGGTDFTFNWIPFGGFCRMKGENGDTEESGSFLAANPWRRLATLLGGPITNLLVGMLLITFIFTRLGAPDPTVVQVAAIDPGTPAAASQMQVGDVISSVNGIKIDSMTRLSNEISQNLDLPVEIVLTRDGQDITTMVTPRKNYPEGQGPLGIAIQNPTIKLNFIRAIPMAFASTIDQGVQLVMIPVRLISGQIAPSDARIVSIKGIYDMYAQVQSIDKEEAAQDPSLAGLNILYFIAVISIALGYTNLLPIPALDGGRILFLLPELLFKKRIRPELEGRVNTIAFALLLVLMVVLVINDIINPVVLK